MLYVRVESGDSGLPWWTVQPEHILPGLAEDTNYLIRVARPDARLFVDDVEQHRATGADTFRWRPSFYAGRVMAELLTPGAPSHRYFLDVSPSPTKSGQEEFDVMVADIRDFDATLLGGTSAATMAFGTEGREGKYEADILLSRLRAYGRGFLDAVEVISRSPHKSVVAQSRALPLSAIRRLHHTSLRDGRLIALARGLPQGSDAMDSFQVHSSTSTPTFDTPANRTLLSLLRRFQATVGALQSRVRELRLGSPVEEQTERQPRRLEELELLARRSHRLGLSQLFKGVKLSALSSTGLTQIASQPTYSRAYRLGCRALNTQIDGDAQLDQLHVPPSWGIYETWCYRAVVRCVGDAIMQPPIAGKPRSVAADRAAWFDLGDGRRIELLFQATFPALEASSKRMGWTLSRERRPDIVLVLHEASTVRYLVLDAKWRSRREYVLEAMESAHIYHDALRMGEARADACLLLLPAENSVPELERPEFIHLHGVGAVAGVIPASDGLERLTSLLRDWMALPPPSSVVS